MLRGQLNMCCSASYRCHHRVHQGSSPSFPPPIPTPAGHKRCNTCTERRAIKHLPPGAFGCTTLSRASCCCNHSCHSCPHRHHSTLNTSNSNSNSNRRRSRAPPPACAPHRWSGRVAVVPAALRLPARATWHAHVAGGAAAGAAPHAGARAAVGGPATANRVHCLCSQE